MRVEDKVIVVTGGASGIGRAMCLRFREEGAREVAVADIDERGAREVAEATKRRQEQPVPALSQPQQLGPAKLSQVAPSAPVATPPTLGTLSVLVSLPPSPLGHFLRGGSERRWRASITWPQESQTYS